MAVVPRSVARRRTFLAALALLLGIAAPAPAQNVVPDGGLYVAVPSPIEDAVLVRVKNRVEQAKPRPSVIVFDFNPTDKEAATPGYGSPSELADYIAGLQDVRTVAYVHRKVTGHTVLPVLACKEIACGPQGALGAVVGASDPPLAQGALNAYLRIPGQVRPAYLAVVQKMIDPRVELRKGRKGGADWYFDLRHRAQAEADKVQITDTAPLPEAPDGAVGLFTATQLRDLGLSRGTFPTRQDLFDAFGLNAAALKDDPLGGRPPVAFRATLKGAIDAGKKEEVERLVKGVVGQKGNVLFLRLECGGGDLQAAHDLAERLRRFEAEDDLLIVAFVPDRAPDTAAVVALGCSEIVLSKRRDTAGGDESAEAEFGDFEAALDKGSAVNVDLLAASLRDLAEAHGYPPLLIDGMLKRDVGIVRVQKKENRNVRRLMTDADYEAQKGPQADWVNPVQVKPAGQLLKLTATQAEELGIARFTVDTRDPAEVYAKYGVDPTRVRDASPAWLDQFASFLKLPAVTVLLVVIGFTGLILELKVPGTTVPGIVAALCFILVFWAHTQFSNQVAVLAGLLFILGLILILLEVFVLPGFGAAGIIGILLMLAGLALVTVERVPENWQEVSALGGKMAVYLLGMIGSFGLALLIARYLPNIPYANRLMLVPPTEKPGADEGPVLPGAALAASLLGAVGTAVTVLRPAGTVRFGDQYVDVVTEGGYVPAGARVQVVEVEGIRIVVKEV